MTRSRIGRRKFLKAAGTGAAAAMSGAVGAVARAAGSAAAQRPNILWITCEDMSSNLGCYGDDFAISPNLDRLATQGVRFTNAFSVCAVCAVGRSSIITGLYPSSLGSHHMRCHTALPDHVKCFSELLRNAGYYCTNNSKTDYNFPVPKNAWDESSGKAHWRKRKAGQPFFAVFNYTVTHESQIRCPPKRYEQHMRGLPRDWRHDPAKVAVPPYHPDTPEVRRDWARYYDLISSMDHKAGNILKQLEEDGLADDTIVFFYSDHGAGMPRCKKWPYDGGTRVPLIVRFPEKHKRWAPGAPSSATDRLVSFVDFAPTVLSLTGVDVPDHMEGSAFLGERAGKPREHVFLMRSRMAERYEQIRGVHDKRFLYLRNYMPHLSFSQHISYTYEMPTMKVWDRLAREGKLSGPPALWFRSRKPLEELYDTQADPHQIHNLADDPKYASVLKKMRDQTREYMFEAHDLGFLPEYDQALRCEGQTPYEMARTPGKYPMKKIVAAAELVGRGPEHLPKLTKLLSDEDPAVRYWAAVGLKALGREAASANGALSRALGDRSANVKMAAADALVSTEAETDLAPVLLAGVRHESEWIRLRALNVLDQMGDAARAALPDVKKALKSKSRWGYDRRLMNRLVDALQPGE